MLQKAKATLKHHLRGYTDRSTIRLDNVVLPEKQIIQEAPETWFDTSDGRKIPVFKNHRYSLKKGWSVYGPLAAFAELDAKNLLSDEDKAFFDEAKGHRTPTASMQEIRAKLQPYLEKHQDLFLSTTIPNMGKRLMKPAQQDVKNTVQKKARAHSYLLEQIKTLVKRPPQKGETALEIGYTSGGQSIIGFEECGMKAVGIDNFYHDSVETVNRHDYIAKMMSSRAEFLRGDITTRTEIDDESTAFIYTLSVIEHITDLQAGFAEMYRILRPGGVMFHHYDPYFHILGGHSPSTLDSPWAHMRMSPDDVGRYIKTLRPHEADISIPWIKNALNRNHTQAHIQQLLARQGFNIRMWNIKPVSPDNYAQLSTEIVNDCLRVNDNVSLQDLLSAAVVFIAEKPID